jgi:hypothetical protein
MMITGRRSTVCGRSPSAVTNPASISGHNMPSELAAPAGGHGVVQTVPKAPKNGV